MKASTACLHKLLLVYRGISVLAVIGFSGNYTDCVLSRIAILT